MSFLHTDYTKRVLTGKTIKHVSTESNGLTKITFTDGSFITVYPYVRVHRSQKSVSWEPEVIVSAYDEKGETIPALSLEESLG